MFNHKSVSIPVFLLLILFSGWSFSSEKKEDPIVGIWENFTLVEFPDENDEEKIITSFTVETTLTVNIDGSFMLLNELDGYDQDGPFTAKEEYTGTWENSGDSKYAMEAHNIEIWGSGSGTYFPERDEFTTVWIEPRGEFLSEFTRAKQ